MSPDEDAVCDRLSALQEGNSPMTDTSSTDTSSTDTSLTDIPTTIVEAAAALRSGELTSVDLTEASIAMADRLDPQLGTYVTRFDEQALTSAARADADFRRGVDRGPLQGIPIGVKDILAMAE